MAKKITVILAILDSGKLEKSTNIKHQKTSAVFASNASSPYSQSQFSYIKKACISRLETICTFLQTEVRVHGCDCVRFPRGVVAIKSPSEHPEKCTGKGLLQLTLGGYY